ncbi:MAG: ADP-ribosylglycohydrolase family protein [Chloroflexi bacterium]|nr:ADP-ribosylglycohydrolase family protein [Chloroflexota bacterium]
MPLPVDYAERVYAGVLGKIIGVYLGRPFEGWTYERILRELGEVKYYVHERLGKPLIVSDDDISGTFTFLRAMPDYGNDPRLTPAQIGQTWLNYLIERQTVLWWGGMGNSTEHTAYLRLKAGIAAPESGSIALNGPIVAEQIGAQIFIDGWAMIAPGDPERAADLARRSASVSHDGVAVHAAQILAAMEAQAFVERDVDRLLDVGLTVIPPDSLIRRLIGDLRDWHARHDDWHACYAEVAAHYGYDKYTGNCHVVPNHALIIMALLYGRDSFPRALTIVNTAGWDTDCNSGNLGCLMGIKEGLAGLEVGPDLRGPVADRLYLPTADGGRAVSDALHEAYEVTAIGRALAGLRAEHPKGGARFHFDLPGATQGWLPDEDAEVRGVASVANVAGHSEQGRRSLAIRYQALADGRPARVQRETVPAYRPEAGYRMVASPTLYPGQVLRARLEADATNDGPVAVCLYGKAFGADDALETLRGPLSTLAPGEARVLEWQVSVPSGCPIAWVGLELTSAARCDGTVYLDWLTWDGTPTVRLGAPHHNGTRWLDAWVKAVSSAVRGRQHDLRLMQDEGTGLVLQGTREWGDYGVSAGLTPHLARSFGLVARAQGLKRYYALRLTPGRAQLVRELDGTTVLAECPFAWSLYESYALELRVEGARLTGSIDGRVVLRAEDDRLPSGAIGVLIEEGRLGVDAVEVRPLG